MNKIRHFVIANVIHRERTEATPKSKSPTTAR